MALALALPACGSRDHADTRDGRGHTADAISSSPASTAVSATAPGTGEQLTMRMDPAYRACTADAACQLTPDCACTRCIPTRQMHVAACPEPCGAEPCAGRRPRCTAGMCVADGVDADAPSAEIVEATRAAGQAVLDDARFVAYLHADVHPERLPMLVAWEPRVPRAAWTIGGQDVRFEEGIPTQPHLLPRNVFVDGDTATFELEYAPEGIVVHARLERSGRGWAIVSYQIVER